MSGQGQVAGRREIYGKEAKTKQILLITHDELCYVCSYHAPAFVCMVKCLISFIFISIGLPFVVII